MLIQQIMSTKSTDSVITIEPQARVCDALQVLAARRIGTVVVSVDGKKADGILSERDIVRGLGTRGPGCMDDKVADLMTRQVVTCTKTDNAVDVLRKMADGRFRHMPIVEDGDLIGLISLGDVIKARLGELAMEKESLEEMIKGGY